MNKMLLISAFSGFFVFSCLGGETLPATNTPTQKTPSPSPAQPATEGESDGLVYFTPPAGWQLADSALLPPHVKVMVVGKGPSTFPPSMNLSMEPYKGTLKQYLKTIKNMNDAQGYEWKDLGTIRTEAGNASLSQVDTKSQWGDLRLMHVILLKNNTIYILTASALKDEFSIFYKDFFASMRSLRVVKDAYDIVVNPQQRVQIKAAADKLESQWEALLAKSQEENPGMDLDQLRQKVFESEQFQNTIWKPFIEMLDQKYSQFGPEWQSLFQKKMKDKLLNVKN